MGSRFFIYSPFIIASLIAIVNISLYLFFVGSNIELSLGLLLFFFLLIGVLFIIYVQSFSAMSLFNGCMLEKYFIYSNQIVFLGALSGAVLLAILYYKSGQNDLFYVARYYSDLRYDETIGMPIEVRFLNIILYASTIIGAIKFFERLIVLNTKVYFFLLPGIILIAESALLGTKSIIVLVAIYYLIAYRIVAIYHHHSIKFVSMLKITLLVMSCFLLIIYGVQYVRTQGVYSLIEVMIKISTSYFSLPMFAFIDAGSNIEKVLSLNLTSFMGIYVYLDDEIIKQGDFIVYHLFDEDWTTNVYTAYYYLMQDFGYLGFYIAIITISLLLLYIERQIYVGRILLISLYIPLSAYVLFAFADPIFKYLTNILVFFFIAIYLLIGMVISHES